MSIFAISEYWVYSEDLITYQIKSISHFYTHLFNENSMVNRVVNRWRLTTDIDNFHFNEVFAPN